MSQTKWLIVVFVIFFFIFVVVSYIVMCSPRTFTPDPEEGAWVLESLSLEEEEALQLEDLSEEEALRLEDLSEEEALRLEDLSPVILLGRLVPKTRSACYWVEYLELRLECRSGTC